MGVVSRDQQRALQGAGKGISGGQQALQHLFEEGAVGAAAGGGAHFLVIGADQYGVFVALVGQQGFQTGIAGQQIVQARGGDEIVFQADQGSGLDVIEAQFEIQHLGVVEAVLLLQAGGQQGAEVAPLAGRHLGQDRRQFVLGIDGPALVGFAIEVDGQVGNDRQRLAEVDQSTLHPAAGAKGHPARQGQVAVEPGRHQHAAVDLDAQLPEALPLQLRLRLDLEAGAVGMGADQAQTALQGLGAQAYGDQRGIVAGDVVAATRLHGPALALVQALVAGGFETAGEGGGGMEGGGGTGEEIDEALDLIGTHGRLRTTRRPV